jgi:hypothetical protein
MKLALVVTAGGSEQAALIWLYSWEIMTEMNGLFFEGF